MIGRLTLILFLFVLFFDKAGGQTIDVKINNPKEIAFQSWRKGNETIKNQEIKISLSSTNKEYQQEIIGDSGKRYLLKIYHSPYSDLDLEHWEVDLYEIFSKPDESNNILSPSLLTVEPDGQGKHVIPKEDYAGIFYIEENPLVISENNEPLYGEGRGLYYYKTVRKIYIENFCLVMKLGDFKFNDKDKNKFDLFEIYINFENLCKNCSK